MSTFIPRLHSREGGKTPGNRRSSEREHDRFEDEPDPYRVRSQDRYYDQGSSRRSYEEEDNYEDELPYLQGAYHQEQRYDDHHHSSRHAPRHDTRHDSRHDPQLDFWEDEEEEYRPTRRSKRSRNSRDEGDWNERQSPMTFALGIAVMVVLAAFGWFVYQWMFPSDLAPPIIRPDHMNFKVRPDNPGGMVIPHQDKLVYGRFAPNEQQTVEHLLAPPEQPIAIEEQQPQQQPPQMNYAQPPIPQPPMYAPPPPPPLPPHQMPPQQPTVHQQPQPQPQLKAETPAQKEKAPEVELDDLVAPDTQKNTAKPQPFVAPAASSASTELMTTPIADGGRYMVQVASAESYTAAEKQWQKLSKAAPELCSKKGIMIKEVGQGKTAYRVFVGPFHSTNTAERFVKGIKPHGFKASILGTNNG